MLGGEFIEEVWNEIGPSWLSPRFASLRLCRPTTAQDAYPSRAIKLIVPFAAGGNTDVVGRLTASYMQKALNVNVVVENRAGAGGINGTDARRQGARPDGYTLCVCGIGPITVSPATEKLPYDPLKDLAPISLINTNPLVLVVNPQVKADTAGELAALSKSVPDGLSYGTVGAGGLMQFAAEIFRVKTAPSSPPCPIAAAPWRPPRWSPARFSSHSPTCRMRWASLPQARCARSPSPRPSAARICPSIPTLIELGLVDYPVEFVERAVRARRHAAAHHRPVGRADGADGEGPGDPEADVRFRLDRRRQHARRVHPDVA